MIERPPSYDGKTSYEGELGIVIGKPCTNVSTEQADDFTFGYTYVDVSKISYDMTLLPSDLIACGTSVGVGFM
ncbi:hypothetical protein CQ13_12015 [Bradyrhizobium retamae]|uniref:Fumarylacetoacetase-like C-terminal domain-containing protein n=1 Tax=Bradyrhizobium retamae TaxID=1300035 RepID=A0A0R3M9V7_9BRAD|nr:hypothetical protein CQ13_12015 [Bradyrhizobium retamae]